MIVHAFNALKLGEELTKTQPDYFYEGKIPADNDTMDFVKIDVKGVRLA